MFVVETLAPFERGGGTDQAHGPFQIQYDLQETMQNLVGIVRREEEMQQALAEIQKLNDRARAVAATGNRDYNPGWHTALDLENLLTVSEAITRSALERKESRGGHFRDDYPEKSPEYATFNIITQKNNDGQMQTRRQPITPLPPELKAIIEEMK